jgi:hypothetical protein
MGVTVDARGSMSGMNTTVWRVFGGLYLSKTIEDFANEVCGRMFGGEVSGER